MTKRKNHSPDFKAKVALETIREEMTLSSYDSSGKATQILQPTRGTERRF
jgi:hypothetical protein